MEADTLYSTETAAEKIHSKPATMQWWRTMGRGPRYVKIGRKVFYRDRDLEAFIKAGEHSPEMAAHREGRDD